MAHYQERSSLVGAFMWMLILSILLYWLPGIGQFVAGLVGGKKAGNVPRAILAFLLPAVVLSIFLMILGPLLPFFMVPLTIAMVAFNFALFCGAVVGGALA